MSRDSGGNNGRSWLAQCALVNVHSIAIPDTMLDATHVLAF